MAQTEQSAENGEIEINDDRNNSLRHICMTSTVIILT